MSYRIIRTRNCRNLVEVRFFSDRYALGFFRVIVPASALTNTCLEMLCKRFL